MTISSQVVHYISDSRQLLLRAKALLVFFEKT